MSSVIWQSLWLSQEHFFMALNAPKDVKTWSFTYRFTLQHVLMVDIHKERKVGQRQDRQGKRRALWIQRHIHWVGVGVEWMTPGQDSNREWTLGNDRQACYKLWQIMYKWNYEWEVEKVCGENGMKDIVVINVVKCSFIEHCALQSPYLTPPM